MSQAQGTASPGGARRAEAPVVYDMAVVRAFALSALIWGAVGMTVGLVIALQLAWPELNWGPYLHFGRLRPIHKELNGGILQQG